MINLSFTLEGGSAIKVLRATSSLELYGSRPHRAVVGTKSLKLRNGAGTSSARVRPEFSTTVRYLSVYQDRRESGGRCEFDAIWMFTVW